MNGGNAPSVSLNVFHVCLEPLLAKGGQEIREPAR